MAGMAAIRLEGVGKRFGSVSVLNDVDLRVREGSFTVLLGAPASGKSTLLRLLIGLETPTSGRVFLRGDDVTRTPPGERNIGYVPQSFALYPHYSVFDNIAYPLTLARVPKAEVTPAVRAAAEQLGIADLLQNSPGQLSGGQKQRVAIARGIVKQTDIFVLDDPLTGLDFKLREQLFDDFRAMQAALQATFFYTTADTLEAQMLAQDILILAAGTDGAGGRVVEAGDFETVYEAPQHVTTMALLGFPRANLLAGRLAQGVLHSSLFTLPAAGPDADVRLAVRPQAVQLEPADPRDLLLFDAALVLVANLGGEYVAYLTAPDAELTAVLRHDELRGLTEGPVRVGISPTDVVVYDAATGARLEHARSAVTARG
ncbi:ABC transporter ATP-binding protein [soil metagenome]